MQSENFVGVITVVSFFLVVTKKWWTVKIFLGIETSRYQQNLGIENGRYQHILVSKQVSVSTDTNVQSIGIGIELKILVSPNTTKRKRCNQIRHVLLQKFYDNDKMHL